jgi:chromosome partitioning protein
MKTIVLANHKGGVGKSAVATLLAHYFVRKGRRVLAIDLDHQGNFSAPLLKSKRVALAVGGRLAAPPVGGRLSRCIGRAAAGLGRREDKIVWPRPRSHAPCPIFARNLNSFLASMDRRFDICVVDTHPNPDIRLIAALASTDFVLSPIQLKQEAMEGVAALLDHERVGLRKVKAVLNPKLQLIGLLPNMVEATPFERTNLIQVVQKYRSLLIPLSARLGDIAAMPRRSAIGEAQAEGQVLWEMKKTAARDAWREIEPSLARIAGIVMGEEVRHVAAA